MKWSRLLVIVSIVVIVVVVAASLLLRERFRCAGFDGPAVSAEELPGPPRQGNLRIVCWNVRNFPIDARPQDADLGFSRLTNICDMETALGGLDADLFALSEVCDTRRFPPILRRSSATRTYGVYFSAGGGQYGQHLVLAPDRQRLELVHGPVELSQLALDGSLRPGLAGYFASTTGGADFSVLTVHLAASPRGYDSRLQQYGMIADWVEDWVLEVGDEDLIVLGDFNSTGAEGGSTEEELQVVDRLFGTAGLERVPSDLPCTEYWEGRGTPDGWQEPALLDHVWVRSLEEMDHGVPLQVWLHCRRHGCAELRSSRGAEDGTFWDVSDHCPLSFEIRDLDLD